MADSNIPITAGSGTQVDTFLNGSGDHQQVIREAPATAATSPSSWTLAVSAAANQVPGDSGRRLVILTNLSGSGTVYLGFGATTAPTTAPGGWHDKIAPQGRLVLEKELAILAISMIADVASGTLEIALFTAA